MPLKILGEVVRERIRESLVKYRADRSADIQSGTPNSMPLKSTADAPAAGNRATNSSSSWEPGRGRLLLMVTNRVIFPSCQVLSRVAVNVYQRFL